MRNEAESGRVREQRPNGPLAVSFDRGKGVPIPCRYDFVYVSPEFSVRRVDYPYDASRSAGSDHSIVIAKVEALISTSCLLAE